MTKHTTLRGQFVLGSLFVVLVIIAALTIIIKPQPTSAQSGCQTLPTSRGTINYSAAATANASRTYYVWVRIKAPNGNPAIVVNATSNAGSLCNNGNGESIGANAAANTWVWARSTRTFAWADGNANITAGSNIDNLGLDCIVLHSSASFTPRTAADCTPTSVGDGTNPTVSLTAPTNNQNVSGSQVMTATATDNVGIASVQFLVNGNVVGTDTSAPYSYTWASDTVANGQHTLAARATDTSGNTATSSVRVNVSNRIQPPAPGTGWLGEYWQIPTTGVPTAVPNRAPDYERIDQSINFSWGEGSPTEGVSDAIPAEGFFVRWTQQNDFEPGRYRFTATTDDGMRVRFNNQTIIDEWRQQAPTTYTAEIDITDGMHTVVVEYFDVYLGATAQMSWERIGNTAPTNNPPTTPTGLSTSVQSSSSVRLTWNAATDPNGDSLQYRVERRTGTGSFTPVATVSGTSHVDTNLTAATTYNYRVIAREAATSQRLESAPSAIVNATTTANCATITFIQITTAISNYLQGTFATSSTRFDTNGDGRLTFLEITTAISNYLNGRCV